MKTEHRRNILTKGESYPDVQSALARCKDDQEVQSEVNRRLKSHGWTKELELEFRRHAQVVGFILPGQERKRTTVANDIGKRETARVFVDKIRTTFREGEVKPNYMDKD